MQEKPTRLTLFSILFSLFMVILFSLPSFAGTPKKLSLGPRPVGAVNSGNGGVYEKGQYGFIFKFISYQQDQLYNGNNRVDYVRPVKGQTPGKKCKERSLNQFQMTFRAGLTENFDARLMIPFFDKEMERQSFNKDFSDDNSGIGDIKLIGRYRILSQKKKDPFNLTVGAGVKLPTGSTDEQDESGTCLPGYLQTGSGSLDPIVELGVHKVMGRHWISGHLLFQLTGEGELGNRDLEKPDMFNYNCAYAYAVSKLVDLQLELNGQVKGKSKLDGVEQANTGGHIVYLTPGVHFKFRKGIHADICVPFPVYRDLNGTQLSEDYRVVAKLAFKF